MRISITNIIFIGVLLRIAIAFWNGFFGPSPGADFDALGLNSFASAVAMTGNFDQLSIGYTPYTNLLGLIYSFTIDHVFVGSLLSCFAWWLSANLLKNSFYVLSVDIVRIKYALLVYALVPSSIMFTAITLREPYQLLFVNLATYAILKIYLHKAWKHWITLILAITGAGVLHGALTAFGILFFVGALLLVFVRGKKGIHWAKFGLMMAISAVVLWYCFSLFGIIPYNLDDGLSAAIEKYQNDSLSTDARTHYKTEVELSSLADLPLFVPIALLHYLFEPFPWRVSAAIDIVLVLENILRGWLIWMAWKSWKSMGAAPLPKRRMLLFIIFFYVLMESIWSLGAVNWGTSVRHHLPALGLLLLAAYTASEKKLRLKNNSTKI